MAAHARFTDSDGATTVTTETLADIFAGTTGTAKKLGVENNGARVMGASPGPANGLQVEIDQVGLNDGSGELQIGLDTATLSRPWSLAVALGGPGAAFAAAGTYGWVVSALNATGETIGSFEVTFNVTDTTKKAILTWINPSGTTQVKVFRTPTPGTYGANSLRTGPIAVTNTFTDDGSATVAGQPRVDNTSGGAGPAYGTPPALGTTPLQLTSLAVGQQAFFWFNRVVPVGTLEDGNDRTANVRLTEV